MNFLLKIVGGPNKGAEIALVEGVAVTFGKGDDCDIVLADPTLPEDPLSISPSADSVSVNGEALEPFAVKTVGATSFAIGPADAPWGELKWPERENVSRGDEETRSEEGKPSRRDAEDAKAQSAEAASEEDPPRDSATPREEKKRHGCLGCIVALALILLALAVLAWIFRTAIADACDRRGYDVRSAYGAFRRAFPIGGGQPQVQPVRPTLAEVVSRYGLELKEDEGPAKIVGNFKTRAERLRATAEAYEARPGIELDLSDDESFRTAAEDALFTLTEGALKVVSATNRVLSVGGVSVSPESLGRTLRALAADLPKLRNVDTQWVNYGIAPQSEESDDDGAAADVAPSAPSVAARSAAAKPAMPALPVCGILTKPYPCLVMRDGTRVLEGAPLGGNVILKIEADAVTVTNSAGRFVWKP